MGLLQVSTYRLRHLAFSLGRAMGLLQVFPRPSILNPRPRPSTSSMGAVFGWRLRSVAVGALVRGASRWPSLVAGRCLGRTCFVFSWVDALDARVLCFRFVFSCLVSVRGRVTSGCGDTTRRGNRRILRCRHAECECGDWQVVGSTEL
jgi:hypothetical protein